MASTVADRLVALAAVFAVLALAASPARASQMNFYSGAGCSGNFLRSCYDFSCCQVPADAVSYEFHHVPGFDAFLFGNDDCSGSPNAQLAEEVKCINLVGFQCACISDRLSGLLKINVATE